MCLEIFVFYLILCCVICVILVMFRIPTKSSAPGFKKLIPNMEKVKPESCQFPYRICHHPCLEDYEYCLKHILEDKMAPYKTCSYMYSVNGRKCNQPAPKDRKDSRYYWFVSFKINNHLGIVINMPVYPVCTWTSIKTKYLNKILDGLGHCPDFGKFVWWKLCILFCWLHVWGNLTFCLPCHR